MSHDSLFFESQKAHLIKLSVLQKISTNIPFTDNINVITNQLLALATECTQAEKGSVMILNGKGELNISAAKHMDEQLIKKHKVKIGEGIAGEVAEQRKAVLVTDIESDIRFEGNRSNRYKTKSFISCPIAIRDRLLGVININDKRDKSPFKEDELILLKIIADQSAVVLEHAFFIDQIRTKTKELEELDSKLIDCEISKAEFVQQISQELRAPIHSIRGAVYYLQKTQKLSQEEQKEFFNIIAKETENLISVTEGLLDFLRLKDTIGPPQGTLINISELITDVENSKSLKDIFSKKNIQLNIDAPDTDLYIVGDKIKIRQFLVNLIKIISFYLENRDTIDVSIVRKDVVEIMIKLSRRMPDTLLSHFLDDRNIPHFDKPYSMIRLNLVKKVAHYHRWNLEMRNDNGTSCIAVRIPENPMQKREVLITTTMQMFVEFISELLNLEICSVMLYDGLTGDLTIRSSRGLSDDIIKFTRVKTGDRISGKVAQEGIPLFVKNIEKDLSPGKRNVPKYNTNSFISLPLKIQNQVVGVTNLSNKRNAKPFTAADFQIASLLSERISYFIEKFSSGKYSESYFRQFIKSFESLLNILKKYFKKQSIAPELTIKILDALGASEEDKKVALYLSLVYDLGLMIVDENISLKKSLSPLEAISLKYHPDNTIFLLDSLELSDVMKDIILHHHERYDGMGYPSGLKGEEIPFLSRVLSVVDSFSAMISERPYRKRFAKEQALEEIKRCSGSLYDPHIVNALGEVIKHM